MPHMPASGNRSVGQPTGMDRRVPQAPRRWAAGPQSQQQQQPPRRAQWGACRRSRHRPRRRRTGKAGEPGHEGKSGEGSWAQQEDQENSQPAAQHTQQAPRQRCPATTPGAQAGTAAERRQRARALHGQQEASMAGRLQPRQVNRTAARPTPGEQPTRAMPHEAPGRDRRTGSHSA